MPHHQQRQTPRKEHITCYNTLSSTTSSPTSSYSISSASTPSNRQNYLDMEATGFGLAIIAEARALFTSIATIISDIRKGPDTFRSLTDELNRLMRHIDEVETRLQSSPAAIHASIRDLFNETLSSVRNILNHCKSTLETVRSKTYPGNASGIRANLRSKLRRIVRSSDISETMNALQPQLQDASIQLVSLKTMLVTGVNIQALQNVVVPKLDSMQVVGKAVEVYHVGPSIPKLLHVASLNFTARGDDGKHSTPEGILKHSILSAVSASEVTAATGVLTPAQGVVGMAGVGKTIALQGLAFDEDIVSRFPGGIHYMSLGQGATLAMAISEIARIMRLTGASTSAAVVERCSLLGKAVDYAVAWFEGKVCLFLVDDLWPTKDCRTGFLNDLRQLIRCCPESRMAITTRSHAIAHSAGCKVDFAARDTLGAVSQSIFMTHATQDGTQKAPRDPTGGLWWSVATILAICGGLPLALAVTGSAVAFLTLEYDVLESACDAYASQLVKQRCELGEEQGPTGSSLNAGISLSLKFLEPEFVKLKRRHGLVTDHTIAQLYESLCVLRHQAWVSVYVLGRMWKIDNYSALAVVRLLSGLSLCTLTFRESKQGPGKEGGLQLHDLHLDYCRRQAEKMKTCSQWHTRLLNGYLEPMWSGFEDPFLDGQDTSFEHSLLARTPRSWWTVPQDEHIHENLARHLVCANLGTELAALLLDARWTHVRFEIGGMLSLKADFECLMTLGEDVFPLGLSREFELIWKAIQVSWGRVAEGKRSFLLQVCGRLFILRTDSAVVRSYLKSVEAHTPLPYLVPVTPFLPDPRSALIMEIPVGGYCFAVDCSPCGRFVAAGAGHDVVVADASTGDIVKRLEGHSDYVTCVTFTAGSKRIVSSSGDKSVVVWEWESSESPARVLKGHSEEVTGIAVCSDGSKIFSCSRDRTLKIWDGNRGTQIEELVQKSDVYCVAVSIDDQYVAIGLYDGTLKVMNSSTGRTVLEDSSAHEERIVSVAFSASGKLLATGSCDKTIRVWNTTTWTCVGGPFRGHTDRVYCVTFSPVGQLLASGSIDGTVRLWNVNNGRNIWTYSDMHSRVTSVSFTTDGERIVSGSDDGNIRILDTRVEAEANERKYGHSGLVWAVAISHDGLRVASASADETIRLWDSRTGNQIGRPLEGHAGWVNCVSFSRDGRYLVSGSYDKTVRRWDAEKLKEIGAPLVGHSASVFCVSFSSDGQRILSGSDDNTVLIWDANSGVPIGNALLGHTASVRAIAESGDGSYVVSRDLHGEVIIWNRVNRTIVFQSKQVRDFEGETQIIDGSGARREMTDEEAENIIRSCGQETPHLWPRSFPRYPAELYCRDSTVYSNVPMEDTILGTLPSYILTWRYNETKKLFVAGLGSGAVAMCSLKV